MDDYPVDTSPYRMRNEYAMPIDDLPPVHRHWWKWGEDSVFIEVHEGGSISGALNCYRASIHTTEFNGFGDVEGPFEFTHLVSSFSENRGLQAVIHTNSKGEIGLGLMHVYDLADYSCRWSNWAEYSPGRVTYHVIA